MSTPEKIDEYLQLYKNVEENINNNSIDDDALEKLYNLYIEIIVGPHNKENRNSLKLCSYTDVITLISNSLKKYEIIDYNLAIIKYDEYIAKFYMKDIKESLLLNKITYISNKFQNSSYNEKYLNELIKNCRELVNFYKTYNINNCNPIENLFILLTYALRYTCKKDFANLILSLYDEYESYIEETNSFYIFNLYYAKMTAFFALGNFYASVKFYKQIVESKCSTNLLSEYENLCTYSYFLALRRINKSSNYLKELKNSKNKLEDYYYYLLRWDYAITYNDLEEVQKIYEDLNKYTFLHTLDDKGLLLKKIKLFCIEYLNKNNKDFIITDLIKDEFFDIIDKIDSIYIDSEVIHFSNIFYNLLKPLKNNCVYHYTNIHSLQNILENNQFWVTESNFLNDITEIKYIATYIETILSLYSKVDNYTTEFETFLKNIYEGLSYYFNINDKRNTIDIDDNIKETLDNLIETKTYILSLSTEKDSLSLWSNYSNNEGYNIGIDINELEKSLKNNDICDDIRVSPTLNGLVQYRALPTPNTDLTSDILFNELYSFYTNASNLRIDDNKMVIAAIKSLIYLGMFVKKNSFSDEREYRIIFRENKVKESFRVKNGAFIPYIQIPFPKECINEINIGPNNNSDISKSGLRRLLEHNEYKSDIPISKSDIPLRY